MVEVVLQKPLNTSAPRPASTFVNTQPVFMPGLSGVNVLSLCVDFASPLDEQGPFWHQVKTHKGFM